MVVAFMRNAQDEPRFIPDGGNVIGFIVVIAWFIGVRRTVLKCVSECDANALQRDSSLQSVRPFPNRPQTGHLV